ncbi:membrane-spanning 4-domains subfamily A member 4D isoform X2 [Amia ocellicauda]|uniref:membrane-spanning 4-domains subfamily A member 4D isoform X2 n=1 Tax=Amia ocellicauda TaxID=2972642 RepID=UPI003464B9AD
MLTSVPTNGGVVIVTQMCPQGPGAVPIGAQQSGLPQGFTSPRDAALKRFVKGEPTALGVVQIMIGLFSIGLGVVTLQDRFIADVIGLPFWTGLIYIVSGAVSIAGEKRKKNNICLMKAAMSMNIVSAVAAGIAILFDLTEVVVPHFRFHDSGDILRSLAWVMLFSSILEFCVAISVSAFGCKAVCNGSPAPVIVIQYGANSQPATQPSNPPGYQLAPDTEQDAFPKTPPPQYTE